MVKIDELDQKFKQDPKYKAEISAEDYKQIQEEIITKQQAQERESDFKWTSWGFGIGFTLMFGYLNITNYLKTGTFRVDWVFGSIFGILCLAIIIYHTFFKKKKVA